LWILWFFSCNDYDICTLDTCISFVCNHSPTPCTINLSISGVSNFEGNSGSSIDNFPVTISPSTNSIITFYASTTDGTAISGRDYIGFINQLFQIPANASSFNVPVTIYGNTYFEPNETFSVTIFNPSSSVVSTTVSITQATATGTILNNNPPVLKDDVYFVGHSKTLSVSAFNGIFENDNLEDDYNPGTLTITQNVEFGVLTLYSNGSFTYTTDLCTGSDIFVYKVSDNYFSATANVLLLKNSCTKNTLPVYSYMYYPFTLGWPRTPNLPNTETGFYLTFETGGVPFSAYNFYNPNGTLPATSITWAPRAIHANIAYNIVVHSIPSDITWIGYPNQVTFVTGTTQAPLCSCP